MSFILTSGKQSQNNSLRCSHFNLPQWKKSHIVANYRLIYLLKYENVWITVIFNPCKSSPFFYIPLKNNQFVFSLSYETITRLLNFCHFPAQRELGQFFVRTIFFPEVSCSYSILIIKTNPSASFNRRVIF